MTFGYKVPGGLAALLMSLAVYAQNAASDVGTQPPANSASTSDQGRADRKAIRAANRKFEKAVHSAIFKTKGLGDADIAVFGNASTGKVVLAGFITDESQDHVAVDAASKAPGVTSVTSRLTLREAGR